ncbi:MAG: 23S rRNA (guanosine(2251)-2'-O)-methyltransferase RlmB [Oscillospiraceae bacterium]|nr:23S rRNA (guanosine(2251)-2'-O)-methyltransferase RlmB [Oscillospiraceae bacterium]
MRKNNKKINHDKKFETKSPKRPAAKPIKPVRKPENTENEKSGMVYGRNAVIELLKSGAPIDKLYVQKDRREGSLTLIVAEAVKKSIPVIEAPKLKLDTMIAGSAHQGVIALASEKEYCSPEDILELALSRGEKPLILIADRIMDPHNLGAIIRSAECAGAHGVIIPKRSAVGISPSVVKASAGAAVHMHIAKVANIASTLEELKDKGLWIFSAVAGDDENSVGYSEADYNLPAAIVVGNEGEGLSRIIIKNSDFLVRIPVSGKIDSLNVSCASAILLFEAVKQRSQHTDDNI